MSLISGDTAALLIWIHCLENVNPRHQAVRTFSTHFKLPDSIWAKSNLLQQKLEANWTHAAHSRVKQLKPYFLTQQSPLNRYIWISSQIHLSFWPWIKLKIHLAAGQQCFIFNNEIPKNLAFKNLHQNKPVDLHNTASCPVFRCKLTCLCYLCSSEQASRIFNLKN